MAKIPDTIRLRLIVTVEYDAQIEYYGGTSDPHAMAEIDRQEWERDPQAIMMMLDEDSASIVVEPVER